jgi:hypothetical protein
MISPSASRLAPGFKPELRGRHIFLHHEEPRFAYIAHLKSGYTSILTALSDQFPKLTGVCWEHQLNLREIAQDYFVFSFVRHPVARLVSCYVDKVVIGPGQALTFSEFPPPQECQSTIFNACVKYRDAPRASPHVSDREVYERLSRLTFGDFVYLLPLICTSDRHLYPQTAWLGKFPHVREHCFIGHVERFPEDWRHVCQTLGCDIPLPHKNKSDYSLPGTVFHINQAWRDMICSVYDQDIQEFYAELVMPASRFRPRRKSCHGRERAPRVLRPAP